MGTFDFYVCFSNYYHREQSSTLWVFVFLTPAVKRMCKRWCCMVSDFKILLQLIHSVQYLFYFNRVFFCFVLFFIFHNRDTSVWSDVPHPSFSFHLGESVHSGDDHDPVFIQHHCTRWIRCHLPVST